MTAERLQKLIARAGVASRRKAEKLISEGRVTVNGRVAALGAKADPERDAILVDGRRLGSPAPHRYLLLNKPRGYLTTRSDPEGRKTVFELVPARYRKALIAAGRLDYDSDGLLVLTDDGRLAHQLTHPRFGCVKTYAVKVKGVPPEAKLDRLRRGIVLEGRRTAPAVVRLRRRPRTARGERNSWLTVQLVEGRQRQIREMFFRIGHPVQRLTRIGIGDLADAGLPVGAYRHLTEEEVTMLAKVARRPAGRAGRRSRRGRRSGSPASAVRRRTR